MLDVVGVVLQPSVARNSSALVGLMVARVVVEVMSISWLKAGLGIFLISGVSLFLRGGMVYQELVQTVLVRAASAWRYLFL